MSFLVMVTAPWGVIFPAGGTIVGHRVPAARGSQGENLVHLLMCDDGAFSVVPFLETSHLWRPFSVCLSGGAWLVVLSMRSGSGGAR
jgi:hypothetical protein